MKESCPSVTALRVAMRRAVHQIIDHPKIFSDSLALRIVGAEKEPEKQLDPKWFEQTPLEYRLRAFLAARSRCAEDGLTDAINRGVRQYVVLGAGLDTFAYRNSSPADTLHVFEVDHPTTQAWKRTRLEEAGIPIPRNLTFCPVDFESETLEEGLQRAELDTRKGIFFSWLGVTPYITSSAITTTLRFVASLPAGSGIVFDYMISPSLLNPIQRRVFDGLARRVAFAGEPFQTFFDPSLLKSSLLEMGFGSIEDLGPEELNARYFQGRTDELRVGSLSHVMNARV
ncbi:class I SAM-dependent methyltransferase [Desulfomonile tiedjei]|uniref:S-adenosyl-L-methionine-dependent methyltransferase n=1 Tax=Desulfomonile tiedjei (strain ATCC 49306 / DSM 6799 / DCB-1) TaxID=706587 RepID=I4CC09_DESTA|nr:SAM-dependent methyltransferase [Desulfomonile tiedjei]AFM27100.1 methyltransferase, putative, TIGR00027 family [Desulfomonile tiedjei DSM 6799]